MVSVLLLWGLVCVFYYINVCIVSCLYRACCVPLSSIGLISHILLALLILWDIYTTSFSCMFLEDYSIVVCVNHKSTT